jgi:hypothetical protein
VAQPVEEALDGGRCTRDVIPGVWIQAGVAAGKIVIKRSNPADDVDNVAVRVEVLRRGDLGAGHRSGRMGVEELRPPGERQVDEVEGPARGGRVKRHQHTLSLGLSL